MMSRRRSPYKVYGDIKASPREFRLNANDAVFYVVDKVDWPTFQKGSHRTLFNLGNIIYALSL